MLFLPGKRRHSQLKMKRLYLDYLPGQALVETALIAPILIFFMIGVFEVGFLLRCYLILSNANREATRFAIRPGYLNYTDESYRRIISQFYNSLSGQIPFSNTGTIIISAISVNTQWFCNPANLADCDCNSTVPFSPTLILSSISNPTMTYIYPATSSEITRLDYPAMISQSVAFNRRLNCEIQKRGGIGQIDTQVTVESFYSQRQLFGFPVLSNSLTDPVFMYAHSTFRQTQHR